MAGTAAAKAVCREINISQISCWALGLFARSHSRHRWMWDYPAMAHELSAVGFTDIRRATFGDSGDAHFNDVEEASRWEGGLGIDCRRSGEGNGSPAGAKSSAGSEKTV